MAKIIKNNSDTKIVFPLNTPELIREILFQNGFSETIEQIIEKMKKGEKILSGEMAKIIKKIAVEKIPIEQTAALLSQQLNIPVEKAVKIAINIQEQIMPLAQEVELTKEELLEKAEEISKKEIFESKNNPPDKMQETISVENDPYKESI